MKVLEIISGMVAGGLFIAFILYLAVRILKAGRDAADYNRRIYDNEFRNRYKYPKP